MESVIALTNGSIVVGGAIYYNNQTYEGNPYGSEMAYVAIVNPVNGAIVNAYQTIYSPPGGDYYASVVKRLLCRSHKSNTLLLVLGERSRCQQPNGVLFIFYGIHLE